MNNPLSGAGARDHDEARLVTEMSNRQKRAEQGTLVIIGGREDKEGKRVILREVARLLNGGKLVIATVASHEPEGYFESYQRAFADLGITDVIELYVRDRAETLSEDKLRAFDGAAGVYFSGGDQLRISSQIGDTPIEQRVREIFDHGGVIAGTSAGAAVMSDTMVVKGSGQESYRIGDLHMAPGLGLIRDVVIDQHFAERGRFGRLLGAVAHNPRELGIGIDEDTAIVVQGKQFEVIGSGAVYVVDGASVTQSNIAEAAPDKALSMYDVRLHVLSTGDRFDLAKRRPSEVPSVAQTHALEAQASS
jgi:cyanophycinase